MIGELVKAVMIGAGVSVGSDVLARRFKPTVWEVTRSEQIGATMLMMQAGFHPKDGHTYKLDVIELGGSQTVGEYKDAAVAQAAAQQWQSFLLKGGSLASWRLHQQSRARAQVGAARGR